MLIVTKKEYVVYLLRKDRVTAHQIMFFFGVYEAGVKRLIVHTAHNETSKHSISFFVKEPKRFFDKNGI